MKPATLVTPTGPIGRRHGHSQQPFVPDVRVGANASHHPTQKSRITGDEDTP
jgi:hypothetical protein